MEFEKYKAEYIRGLNILHFIKKFTGIPEAEINPGDLDLENFFCGENIGGFPFWTEVEAKREEGFLIQEPSDIYRLFSELFEMNASAENGDGEENGPGRIADRTSETAGLFLKLCWYKVMAPKEFYAALFTAFVCYELDYELLYADEGMIRQELAECMDFRERYGLSEKNGDLYIKDEIAILELALECRQKGIGVLPPDINLSDPYEFHVEEAGIRMPFDFPYRELAWPVVSRICERRKEKPFRRGRELEDILPLNSYGRLLSNRSLAAITEVFTGMKELHERLGGFLPGSLYYVAGRPGMGVTTFLKKLASSVSKTSGKVRYYCIEEPVWDPGENGIFVKETGKDFLDLEKTIRDDDRPQLIIIDGFEYVYPFRYPLRGISIARKEMNRRLKLIAKDLGVPIVVSSSVSRCVEARADHRPQLQDVFGADCGREYVDGVLTLYREGYYVPNGDNTPEVDILKSPEGKTGRVKVDFKTEETGGGHGIL